MAEMKKLLLMLVLSFLVFLNIRLLGGVREAELLLQENCGRRSTCDIAYDQTSDADISTACLQSESPDCLDSAADTDVSQEPPLQASIQDVQNEHEESDEELKSASAEDNQTREDQGAFARLKNLVAKVATYKKCKKDREPCNEISVWDDDEETHECCASFASIQEAFSKSLESFSARLDCNEFALKQLLELIHNELELVEALIYPTAGNCHALLRKRRKMLDNAIPSIHTIYDKLLSLATYSASLNDQYAHQMQEDNVKLSLKGDNKKLFLHAVYQRIADLKVKIQNMQHRRAIH